ncbi:MAG TPA: hypothetical protein VFY43_03790 [Candidatus Limnocylindria bacterium]|nr:hypothetical protein [Candidatus Limnocylindria bacterium]
MVRLTRFGVVRTASVAAIVYLIFSAIIFIPVALIVGTTPITVVDQFGQPVTTRISPIVFLFLPLIYAVVGWVFTALACLIYNLAAWITGGIEFEAVAVAPAPPSPVYTAPPPAAPPPTGTPPATPPETGAP